MNNQMTSLITHFFLFFVLLLFSTLFTSVLPVSYLPTDYILLDCGSNSSQTRDTDGRNWTSDGPFVLSPQTSTATASSLVDNVPFATARVFDTNMTYVIPVSPGRKFVRLYFYPGDYGYDTNHTVFTVKVDNYTLLSNFSVSSQTTKAPYLPKEFNIYVRNPTLNLTFIPFSNFFHSFAFVNGIEVVSVPDNLYNIPIPPANITTIETMFRLNVGGSHIPPTHDTGLFRSWFVDTTYVYGVRKGVNRLKDHNITIMFPKSLPSYIAPVDVYSTVREMTLYNAENLKFNLTWLLSVDIGFSYLVRLHFCEISETVYKRNQVVFDIYINNNMVKSRVDIVQIAGGQGIPCILEFLVYQTKTEDLIVALHPNPATGPEYYNSRLNGLEVFKLNNSQGMLAKLNPIPSTKNSGSISSTGVVLVVVGGVVLLCIVSFFVYLSHKPGEKLGSVTESHMPSHISNLCRRFPFTEIQSATNDFDEFLVLGVGGFGKVYKAELDGGTLKVAIKRGNSRSGQGMHEFQTEIELLSKLRHRHLVSLLGYCEENREMILVYDYMALGTLRDHLYKTSNPPLPWRLRLKICIETARGLHYLHTGAGHTIIHRDVKTTNILLDEMWVAKVSDFGLSKTVSLDETHVSTDVKGSFGYMDPEYCTRQQLTEKSDVYSFGVVLLEVLCARPALDRSLHEDQISLVEYAVECSKKGTLEQIMDPYLKGEISPECLRSFTTTAMQCVARTSRKRPSMGVVLWNLEDALLLQEKKDVSVTSLGGSEISKSNSSVINSRNGSDIGSHSRASDVFSQIIREAKGGRGLGGSDITKSKSERMVINTRDY